MGERIIKTKQTILDEFEKIWEEMAENLGSSITSGDMRERTKDFLSKALDEQREGMIKEIEKKNEDIQIQIGKIRVWGCEDIISILEIFKKDIIEKIKKL